MWPAGRSDGTAYCRGTWLAGPAQQFYSIFVRGMQDEPTHPKLTFRCRPPANLPSLTLAGSHLACSALLATVHTQKSSFPLPVAASFRSIRTRIHTCKENRKVSLVFKHGHAPFSILQGYLWRPPKLHVEPPQAKEIPSPTKLAYTKGATIANCRYEGYSLFKMGLKPSSATGRGSILSLILPHGAAWHFWPLNASRTGCR